VVPVAEGWGGVLLFAGGECATCGSKGASSYSSRMRPGAGMVAAGMVTMISDGARFSLGSSPTVDILPRVPYSSTCAGIVQSLWRTPSRGPRNRSYC
jgi:hypothetical protein